MWTDRGNMTAASGASSLDVREETRSEDEAKLQALKGKKTATLSVYFPVCGFLSFSGSFRQRVKSLLARPLLASDVTSRSLPAHGPGR